MTPSIHCRGDRVPVNIEGPVEAVTKYLGAPQYMMVQAYRAILAVYPHLYNTYGYIPPIRYTRWSLGLTGEGGIVWNDEMVKMEAAFPHFNIYVMHWYAYNRGSCKFYCCINPILRDHQVHPWPLAGVFDVEGIGSLVSTIEMLLDYYDGWVECLTCYYSNNGAAYCGLGKTINTGTCNQWEDTQL